MIKTLTWIAGVGLGTVLVCALASPRKGKRSKRRPESALSKLTHPVNPGNYEINATSHAHIKRTSEFGAELIVPPGGQKILEEVLAGRVGCQSSHAASESNRISSAWRLIAAAGGGALVLHYLYRRDSLGMALGVTGLGMLTRIVGDDDIKRSAAVAGSQNISKSEWLLICSFIPLAFLTRLLILPEQDVITPDGVYYATLGKSLVSGKLDEGLSAYWPPLYPLLVGLASFVSRDLEFAGRLVSMLAGSLLVAPVYLLIRRLHGMEAAFIGMFLVNIYPPLIHYSTLILTESTYTLFFVSAVLTELSALSSGKGKMHFLAGLLFGACYLIKPEAIGYVALPLCVPMLTAKLLGDQVPIQKLVRDSFIFLSGVSVLSLPYILYLRRATGRWTVSDKLQANWPTSTDWATRWFNLPATEQVTRADRFYAGNTLLHGLPYESLADLVKAINFPKFIGECFDALKMEFSIIKDHTLTAPLILVTGAGFFKAAAAPEEIYLLLFLLSTLIGYALFPEDVDARLLLPLIPLLLTWAARGVVECETWLIKLSALLTGAKPSLPEKRKLLESLALAALALCFCSWLDDLIRAHHSDQAFEHKEVARWIKEHSAKPEPVIMAQGPWAAFYAGGRPIYLPTADYLVMIEHARRHKVDFIVLDQSHRYPELQFLFDEGSQHAELTLIYRYDEVPHRKALVFALSDTSELTPETEQG